MKKLFASVTLVCYLAMSSGVIVNFHYCMNKLASVKFFQHETKVCGQCGMETHEAGGCCHDEVQVVKMDDDQNKNSPQVYFLQVPEPVATITSDFMVASFTNSVTGNHFQNHSPPLLSEQDTYLQNRIFRI
jgi:hypothetical protein